MPAAQRTIFDLGQGSQAALPAVLNLCTAVLVPLSPDLNSVVSVPILENFLQANSSVYYVFNYFDERSPQCRHARDFVLRHCGNRLLPISLRRDRETQVTDKDTETGMFGADQLPGLELAADYMELALWIRRVAPLTAAALVPARWSEQ